MKYHNIPTLFDNQASLINGKNIGTDSVRYIQDAGQKTAGTTYIDKNTNELYVCVTTTNSVNNDSNFSKFNLKEAFNKLDSLGTNRKLISCTGIRRRSITYKNENPYPIWIFIREVSDDDDKLYIDGILFCHIVALNTDVQIVAIVPPNSSYRYEGSFTIWYEYR